MFPAISAKPPRRPSPGDVHLRPLLWVLPGHRSEGMAVYEGKGGVRAVWREGELLSV